MKQTSQNQTNKKAKSATFKFKSQVKAGPSIAAKGRDPDAPYLLAGNN